MKFFSQTIILIISSTVLLWFLLLSVSSTTVAAQITTSNNTPTTTAGGSGENTTTTQQQQQHSQLPLSRILVDVPSVMYVGLPSIVTVTVDRLPSTGTVHVTVTLLTSLRCTVTNTGLSFGTWDLVWNSTSSSFANTFSCTPDHEGSHSISFSPVSEVSNATQEYEGETRNAATGAFQSRFSFASLHPSRIFLTMPPPWGVAYIGIPFSVNITLERLPAVGTNNSSSLRLDMTASGSVNCTPTVQLWTGDTVSQSRTIELQCAPVSLGVFGISFGVAQQQQQQGAVPFSTKLTDTRTQALTDRLSGNVVMPTSFHLAKSTAGAEHEGFVGSVNAIGLQVRQSLPLLETDNISFTLTTNVSSSSGLLVGPVPSTVWGAVRKTAQFDSIFATRPCTVQFTLSFTVHGQRNRFFISNPSYVVVFRPLVQIRVTPPPRTKAVLSGEVLRFRITPDELPLDGDLWARLEFSGPDSSSVMLSSPIFFGRYPSTDLTQTVSARIVSSFPDDENNYTLTVVFSNNNHFNMTSFVWDMPRWRAKMAIEFVYTAHAAWIAARNPASLRIVGAAATDTTVNVTVTITTSSAWAQFVQFRWMSVGQILGASFVPVNNGSEPWLGLDFALSGPDARLFDAPAPRIFQLVDRREILIHAPNSPFAVYLGGAPETIGISISEAPLSGPALVVTPTAKCAADAGGSVVVSFSVPQLQFARRGQRTLYTDVAARRLLTAAARSSNCRLEFSLSSTSQFSPTSSVFSFHVQRLFNFSITAPVSVYVGSANEESLTVSLDPGLASATEPWRLAAPLRKSVRIMFTAGSPCLRLSPTFLRWSAGSSSEPVSRQLRIRADTAPGCPSLPGPGVRLPINITIATESEDYNRSSLPPVVFVRALPRLRVHVESLPRAGDHYFTLFPGETLRFLCRLEELLPSAAAAAAAGGAAGETVTVVPVVLSNSAAASVAVTAARWSSSDPPESPPLRYATITALAATAHRVGLQFSVLAPPRYDQRRVDANNATLRVLAAPTISIAYSNGMSLDTRSPYPLTEGVDITVTATLPSLSTAGSSSVVTVTPVWGGPSGAVTFSPSNVTLVEDGDGMRVGTFTLSAVSSTGGSGFTIRYRIDGANITGVAADSRGLLSVVSPAVISVSGMPEELAPGGPDYKCTITPAMPVLVPGETLEVVPTSPMSSSSPSTPCLIFSPTSVVFSYVSSSSSLSFRVVPNAVCEGRVTFSVRDSSSHKFNTTVPPRKFRTVPIPVDHVYVGWYSEAYAGQVNSPSIDISIFNGVDGNTTLTFEQLAGNKLNVIFPATMSLASGSTKRFPIYSTEPGHAKIRINSSSSSSPPFPSPVSRIYNITFYPLLSVQRTFSGTTMQLFPGDDNGVLEGYTISPPGLRLLPDRTPLQLRMELYCGPRCGSSGNLVFGMTTVVWDAPTSLPSRFISIVGLPPSTATPSTTTVGMTFSGTGASVLTSTALPHSVEIQINHLLNVVVDSTTLPPSSHIYVHQSISIDIIAPLALEPIIVELVVDGDSDAVAISPRIIVFFKETPRRQSFNISGVYPTPLHEPALLRMRLVQAPSFVALANGGSIANVEVLPLRIARRTMPPPSRSLFVLYTNSSEFFTFAPANVSCVVNDTKVATSVFVPRWSFVSISVLSAGVVTVTCSAGSHYTPIAPFTVVGLPRGTLSIQSLGPQRKTAILSIKKDGTVIRRVQLNISVSARPVRGTLMLSFPAVDSVACSPPSVIFTSSSSSLWQIVTLTPRRVTYGAFSATWSVSGPTYEYRMWTVGDRTLSIEVKPALSLSVRPTAATAQRKIRVDSDGDAVYRTTLGSGSFSKLFFDVGIVGSTSVPLESAIEIVFHPWALMNYFQISPKTVVFEPGSNITQVQIAVWAPDPPEFRALLVGLVLRAPPELDPGHNVSYFNPVAKTPPYQFTVAVLEFVDVVNRSRVFLATPASSLWIFPGASNERTFALNVTRLPRPGQPDAVVELRSQNCSSHLYVLSSAPIRWSSSSISRSMPFRLRASSVAGSSEKKVYSCEMRVVWQGNSSSSNNSNASAFDGFLSTFSFNVVLYPLVTFSVARLLPPPGNSIAGALPADKPRIVGPPLTNSSAPLQVFQSQLLSLFVRLSPSPLDPAAYSSLSGVRIRFTSSQNSGTVAPGQVVSMLSHTTVTSKITVDFASLMTSNSSSSSSSSSSGITNSVFDAECSLIFTMKVVPLLVLNVGGLEKNGVETLFPGVLRVSVTPPAPVDLAVQVSVNCPEITVESTHQQLVWAGGSLESISFLIFAASATDAGACALTLTTIGGISQHVVAQSMSFAVRSSTSRPPETSTTTAAAAGSPSTMTTMTEARRSLVFQLEMSQYGKTTVPYSKDEFKRKLAALLGDFPEGGMLVGDPDTGGRVVVVLTGTDPQVDAAVKKAEGLSKAQLEMLGAASVADDGGATTGAPVGSAAANLTVPIAAAAAGGVLVVVLLFVVLFFKRRNTKARRGAHVVQDDDDDDDDTDDGSNAAPMIASAGDCGPDSSVSKMMSTLGGGGGGRAGAVAPPSTAAAASATATAQEVQDLLLSANNNNNKKKKESAVAAAAASPEGEELSKPLLSGTDDDDDDDGAAASTPLMSPRGKEGRDQSAPQQQQQEKKEKASLLYKLDEVEEEAQLAQEASMNPLAISSSKKKPKMTLDDL